MFLTFVRLTVPIYAALEAEEIVVILCEVIRCRAVACSCQAVAPEVSIESGECELGDAKQVILEGNIGEEVVLWNVKVGAHRLGLVEISKVIQFYSFEYLARPRELAV